MAEASSFEKHWPKMIVALLLTFASGLVDIVGYLGVFHFFTAHLTGTTVQLGHNLVSHNWIDVFAAAAIVGAFVAGSVVGRAIIEAGSRKRIRRVASLTLTIEALMLVGLTEIGVQFGGLQAHANAASKPYWSLAVLAAAMGMQTATLTGIGPLTVHTTFVTGMLNKIAQLVSHIGFRTYDLIRSKTRDPKVIQGRRADIEAVAFLIAIWMFYVGGAAFGTWSYYVWGLRALYFAVGLLAIGIATDRFSPLSIREEKEQSER